MTTATHEAPHPSGATRFDAYAENYDQVLNAALAASGETRQYFAAGRLRCLAELLKRHGAEAVSVLDYGCGTGTSMRLFFDILGCRGAVGVDVSPASLAAAARDYGDLRVRFETVERYAPSGQIDLAYSNGVFHHIAPEGRLAALSYIYRSLHAGGLFAFCENNPWNPGTRHCMRVNPFDRGTAAISSVEARRLLSAAGFHVLETRYLFFFPRQLSHLRFFERCLGRIPLGGQYLILAAKRSRPAKSALGHTSIERCNLARRVGRVTAPIEAVRLMDQLMEAAPFQPATNLWRAIELAALARELPATGAVLDVGCGDGQVTRILRDAAGAGWRLTGLDPDPLETSLAAATGAYDRVHVAAADSIPEKNDAFDLAIANSVLEHFSELPSSLREIARCLRPGGLLAATVPAAEFHEPLAGPGRFSRRSRLDYLRELDKRLAHVNYWSRQRWHEELALAGFEPPSITSYFSPRQVRRWEAWSNWTGGLLYRMDGGRRPPIAIQRALGIRRQLPRIIGCIAAAVAKALARGVLDERMADEAEALGACYLVLARKASPCGSRLGATVTDVTNLSRDGN